jgi:hypothetical protein
MAKLPSFQFYPGDWLKDPALRCCSPAARGVWIDLLCLMFEATERGVLRIKNGSKMKPISIKTLCKTISGCKPKMIQELIDNGVIRTARKDGALYSKRMARDELRMRHYRKRASRGGRAKALLNPCLPSAKQGAKSCTSSSSSSSPSGLKSTTKRKKPIKKEKVSFLDCVFLTTDEHRQLVKRFGPAGAKDRIQELNDGIMSKGYKYKSHYHAILTWDRKHEKDGHGRTEKPPGERAGQEGPPANRDYGQQESAYGGPAINVDE